MQMTLFEYLNDKGEYFNMTKDEMIELLDTFASEKYPNGIEMYADYRDEISAEDVAEILESSDPYASFSDSIYDAYYDSMDYYINDVEQEFDSWCEDHGYDCSSDDLAAEGIYVQEFIDIYPDEGHFLDQEFKCRLIVDNGDANHYFTCNPNYDNDFTIEDGAGIIWLGDQMGYSRDMMQYALNEGINKDLYPIDDTAEVHLDQFLESLVHEAANAYGCPMLTFLCRMSLRDLLKFTVDHTAVTVELNGGNCGFFDGYNGGGSVLELECPKKSVTIPYDKIYSLVPDVKCAGMYSVDDVYGLVGSVYADATVG